MIEKNTPLEHIADHVKTLFKQAGYHARGQVLRETSGLLRVSAMNRIFDIRWRPYLNDMAISTLLNLPHSAQGAIIIAATGYLTKGMFERFRSKGLSVFDEYGNGIIKAPGFYYERYVEPQSKGRPTLSGTPFSMKAARLVRAFLADPNREWRQIELVRETGVTQGYASSKLKSLVAEGYCSEAGGTIRLIDAERLLDDWASHYRFDRHRRHRFAFHAKSYENGLRRLAEQLEKARIEYAFTGWSGAFLRAPYGTPREWTAFVAKIPDNPEALGLYPVQQGENALLITAQDKGVFQYKRRIGGLCVAADPQVYIDLVRMPGRAREQARSLRDKYLLFAKDIYAKT